MAFPPSHSFMFQTHHEDLHSTSSSLTTHNNNFPSFPPQHFPGGFMMKRSMSFSGTENNKIDEVPGDDDLSDDGSQLLGEKKKRLSLEQVKALEKSFEVGNKLEPERKMQLAKALGLQPRQIAIWFQNRRARWKTKNLEKEYEILKKQFEALKADNDTLKAQNQKLHSELQTLKGRELCETGTINLKKDTEGSWSNGSDQNSSDINLDLSRTPLMNSPVSSQTGKNLILPNSLKPNSITQLLQCSSRSDLQDESFTNMFHNIDDQQQQNFWPWPEEHHFH